MHSPTFSNPRIRKELKRTTEPQCSASASLSQLTGRLALQNLCAPPSLVWPTQVLCGRTESVSAFNPQTCYAYATPAGVRVPNGFEIT